MIPKSYLEYGCQKSKKHIILFFAIVAFVFTLPIFHNFDNWGIQDWDQHLFYHAVPRASILEYHQFPLWNPYYCGGTVLLANPQSRTLSPTFLLILIFNEVRGIKIDIWLHLIIGMLGVYWLVLRYYNLGSSPAIIASFVFMLNSMYALNLTVGMTWFLTVAYLPWAFLFYLKSLNNLRYSLISGIFLTLMFFGGGGYPLSITILFLFFYSFFLIVSGEQKVVKVGKSLCIILAYTLCLGAIKFFPFFEFAHEHPRYINDYSGFSLNSIGYSLFSRNQTLDAINKFSQKDGFIGGISYAMDENGMYIGIIPLVLFLIGIGLHYRRKIPLVLCFLLFLWISFGNRIPLSFWNKLHSFPLYNSLRVAQRFRIIFMLCLSIFVGLGFKTVKDSLSKVISNRALLQFFELISIIVILADLMIVNSPIWKEAFLIPPPKITRSSNFYQIYRSSLYPAFLSNIGTIAAYETANCPRAAIPVGSDLYKGEAYIYGTTGEAHIVKWSPNRIVVEISALGEGYLVLNQNYYSGWRVKGNKKQSNLRSIDGMLAVKIYPFEKEIELYYLPTSFIIGLITSFITLLLSVILLRKVLCGRRELNRNRESKFEKNTAQI